MNEAIAAMNQDSTKPSKGNILLVDDTPANLRLLVGILTEKGYKVRPVTNGQLALSAARGLPPDLILLDINMPGMNGYQVCEKLKADELTCGIPVIFISAMDEAIDKIKAFAVGGVDYITKPFQVEEVLARVETHLSIYYLEKELREKNEKLNNSLHQLKSTQDQLIESEKMAALGHLIAGIAHEVNTPLAAIRSSIQNIADFWTEDLFQFSDFFQTLSREHQQTFLALIQKSSQQSFSFSTKEKRLSRKVLIRQMEEFGIEKADIISDTLVDLGIYEDISPFVSLLQDPDSLKIVQFAYQIASLQISTQTIMTATNRAAKVVYALKNYARYDSTGAKILANITEGIETVLTLYRNQFKQGVEIVREYEDELPLVLCYPDELNQVWTNLIHNALQAMDNQGILKIEARQMADSVRVSITDTGTGIAPEIMPRIFEPFFTTKPAGEGSGLGLDIVKKIIDKHHGKIEVASGPNQTTFTVFLSI